MLIDKSVGNIDIRSLRKLCICFGNNLLSIRMSKTSMNQLTRLSWLTLTLASINSWTTVMCPLLHASIRGDSPFPFWVGDKSVLKLNLIVDMMKQ